jgi:hypothetical protein
MTPQRLREILTRLRAGHGLTTAEADELDTEFDRLASSPERQLVDLVSGIGARTATSFERADQAHERAAASLSHTDAVVARIEPVFTRLAAAEADRVQAEADRIRQENARRDKLFGGVGMALEAAIKSGWAKILGAGFAGWLMSKLTIWLTP